MTFTEQWHSTVIKKNSILCVGIDPPEMQNKAEWCINIIKSVAPYAAAIKINRNFIHDLSRKETQQIVQSIHQSGMLAISDNKIGDIGSTNEASFHHAAIEGFDAITVSPFPGNITESVQNAHKNNLGIFILALMSNPEFTVIKNAIMSGKKAWEYFVEQSQAAGAEGIVVGAPSEKNKNIDEIMSIKSQQLILVPGIGAQGGDVKELINHFGDRIIANVGRSIFTAQNPATEAKKYNDMLNAMRL